MKIKCDQEGMQTIQKLCDIALRSGGVQNLTAINGILQVIEKLEDEPKEND